jgi:hypothetical protein
VALRMRRPETAKLDLADGEWLIVKKHLTAGERRAMFGRMYRAGESSDTIDSTRVGLAKILTYLLDWSTKDMDGKQVVISDQPTAVVESALDALDVESFSEILRAVQAHDAAMEKARAEEKNDQDGATASSAISPSAEPLVGATTT